MLDWWYELELCPKNDVFFYKEEERANDNAGYDVYSVEDLSVYEEVEFIPFGISARMMKVYESGQKESVHYWLTSRSSIYKSGLFMANSVGVIDSTYRGELKAPVWSMTGHSKVAKGDRLFQIVAPDMGWIRYVRIVDSLDETERGAGGFGSTGA